MALKDVFAQSSFASHHRAVKAAPREVIFNRSLILSALLYSIIFLVLRGTLVIKGGLKLSLDPNERWDGNVKNYHRFVARIARSMLW